MELKNILRKLIEERGVTVTKVSNASKVPAQTIHNWLSGVEPRSFSQVKKVSDYFGVTLDYLCFGIKEKSQSKFENYSEEINAGVFEVVLRRIKR